MLSVDRDQPLQSLMEFSRDLGPIIRMDIMGTPLVVVSGQDLVDALCDESRFEQAVRGSLRRVFYRRQPGAELEQSTQHSLADL